MNRLKFPDDISPSGAQAMFDEWYDVHLKAYKMAENVELKGYASETAPILSEREVFLWKLLDDISTFGDVYKPEPTSYFMAVSKAASQRHKVLTSDGYNLAPTESPPMAQTNVEVYKKNLRTKLENLRDDWRKAHCGRERDAVEYILDFVLDRDTESPTSPSNLRTESETDRPLKSLLDLIPPGCTLTRTEYLDEKRERIKELEAALDHEGKAFRLMSDSHVRCMTKVRELEAENARLKAAIEKAIYLDDYGSVDDEKPFEVLRSVLKGAKG